MKVCIEKFQSEANLKQHFHNSEKIQKSVSVTVFKNYMSKTLLEL